jgi:hypothetical protein
VNGRGVCTFIGLAAGLWPAAVAHRTVPALAAAAALLPLGQDDTGAAQMD